MSGRETILASIRAGKGASLPPSCPGPFPAPANFVVKATASLAKLHEADATEDVPMLALAILAEANTTRLHLAEGSHLHRLPWDRAPAITLTAAPPEGNDTAMSQADFGVAETGTLGFLSGAARPSSWHFLPGREIVLLSRRSIHARLEEALGGIAALPATLNLVTGPSRTGDIEQTMELGAHGPRELHIILVP